MRTILIISLAVFLCLHSFAQKSSKAFHSYMDVGLLSGKSGAAFHFNTDHGMRFNDLFIGAGVGYDTYKFRSLPIFFSGKLLLGRHDDIFLFGKLGYNLPFNENPEPDNIYQKDHSMKGGIYTSTGLGFRTALWKAVKLNLSGGFSYKESGYSIVNEYPCLTPPCPQDKYSDKFSFGRLLLAVGLEF